MYKEKKRQTDKQSAHVTRTNKTNSIKILIIFFSLFFFVMKKMCIGRCLMRKVLFAPFLRRHRVCVRAYIKRGLVICIINRLIIQCLCCFREI